MVFLEDEESEDLPDLFKLIDIVNQRRVHHCKPVFGENHPAWLHFTQPMVQALLNAVRDQFSFHPMNYPDLFRPVLVDEAVAEGVSLFYLRVHQTQSSSAIELLMDYSAKFPADIGWSTVMLEKLQLLASDQLVSLIYAGVTIKGRETVSYKICATNLTQDSSTWHLMYLPQPGLSLSFRIWLCSQRKKIS